jgi:hypothetical protein
MKFLQGKTPLFWWRLLFASVAAAFSLLMVLQPAPWRVLAEAGGMENFVLAQTVYFWTWWGGLASALIAAGLFVLAPWWAKAPAPAVTAAKFPPAPRWFWPLTLAAVLACAAIAGPTLTHSLWDDENESLSYYSLGRFLREGDEGKLRFKNFPWRRTVFGYDTPNNHVFHNVLSRASNSLWRSVAKPRGLQFNHVAIRLPAFLAALAGVAALALLLKQFGYPAGGVAAAWFFALNPWLTEHAAVARGYTLVMLLVVLAALFWRRALLQGSWLWWFSFATAQFLAMWTYPGSIFLLAPLNLAAVLLIWRRPAPLAGPARTQLSRWFCVNSLVAAGLLPLLLPLLPQMKKYIAKLAETPHDIGAAWLRDVFWFFSAGAPWVRGSSSADWKYLDVQLVAGWLGPAGLWALGAVVVLPVLAGVLRLARGGWTGFALAVCTIAAPCLQFFYAREQRIFIWEWYVIFALPFVAMFWGLGAASIAGLLGRIPPRLPWMAPLAGTVLVLLYALTTHPVRAWKSVHAKTPHRESTQLTRANASDYRSAENRHILTFSITNPSTAYDPNLIVLRNPAELVLLCLQADRENRPLYGNLGHMHVMERDHPRELALLRDTRLFGTSTKIGGADAGWDRFVYIYTPGSASNYDFTAVLDPDEMAFVEANVNRRPESVFAKKKDP